MSKALEEVKILRGFNKVELKNDKNVNKSLDIIEQALQRLEAIDNTNPSKVLEELEMLHDCSTAIQELPSSNWVEYAENEAELDLKLYFGYENIKQALLKAQEDKKKVEALKELFANHIELVVEKDRCYFKIKNSKGKEKSFTSYSMLDFWKEVLE